ncbi:MAG: hypothetical protein ACREQN_08560 [Candidatus Binataceae bacterium]
MAVVTSFAVAALTMGSCARFQPTTPAMSASNYTPAGMLQSVTMKDSSIHYEPSILKPGSSRSQINAAFGAPNATRTTDSGQAEDVYAFNPDGTKFVNPQLRPRNAALAFFTMGTSVAVRQARLSMTEKKLTLYHVLYTPNNIVQSVREEKMSNAPEAGPAVQTPPFPSGEPQSGQAQSGPE